MRRAGDAKEEVDMAKPSRSRSPAKPKPRGSRSHREGEAGATGKPKPWEGGAGALVGGEQSRVVWAKLRLSREC